MVERNGARETQMGQRQGLMEQRLRGTEEQGITFTGGLGGTSESIAIGNIEEEYQSQGTRGIGQTMG